MRFFFLSSWVAGSPGRLASYFFLWGFSVHPSDCISFKSSDLFFATRLEARALHFFCILDVLCPTSPVWLFFLKKKNRIFHPSLCGVDRPL